MLNIFIFVDFLFSHFDDNNYFMAMAFLAVF